MTTIYALLSRHPALAIALLAAIAPVYVSGNQFVDVMELPLEQLMSVKITTSSRHRQPQNQAPSIVTVVTAAEIRQFGANNLLEVLERVPSVYMTGSFFFPQNVLSMRGDLAGHYDNHTLLLLNGRPFRESYGGGVNFPLYNSFPLQAIDRIEVIRGPGSPLYGTNAYSAVVNIITFRAVASQFDVTTTAGSFDTTAVQVNASHQAEDAGIQLSLKALHEDGWNYDFTDTNSQASGIDAGENNLGILLTGFAGNWTLNGLYTRSVQDFIGSVTRWAGQPPADERDIRGERMLLDIGHRTEFSPDAYLESNLSHGYMNFQFRSYEAYSRDSLLELTGHWQLHDKLRWLLGGNYWHQDVGSRGRTAKTPVDDFMTHTWETYTQVDIQALDNLYLFTGMQVNKPENLDSNLVPRLGITWNFADHWGIKLLYAEAYRAPYGVETNVNIVVRDGLGNIIGGLRGNPALEPEQVETWDAQIFFHDTQSKYAATLFQSLQQGLVTRQRAPDNILDHINRGELRIRGLELEAEHRLARKVSLTGSYTYQENEDSTGIENFTGVPNHMAKLGLSFELAPGINIGVEELHYSHAHDIGNRSPGRAEVNPDADAYNMVTANMRFDLSQWVSGERDRAMSAGLYAYNLLDENVHQPEFVGRRINTIPARAGRSLYLSVTLSF